MSEPATPAAPYEVPLTSAPLSESSAKQVGFRELSIEERHQIVKVRALGDQLCVLLTQLNAEGSQDGEAKRWRAIARTHFQEGCMAAVRSITLPEFF